ncbi:hypothetical protein [Sphingomonas sp. 10B4]|nr:hypothetical protein [Sphingomonas sp. 10B4]MDY7525104.1 hypothetical protein [Sphingomonas sp. 10B4]MEB0283877.1 hypothetical protein [Sphingomonas sp. 10B4]
MFRDETGVTINMVRYRRGPGAQRAARQWLRARWRSADHGRLAGLDRKGIMTPLIVGQPMSRAVLLDYAWQSLVPALQRR